MIEVRLAVEPVIARLAALRASQADIRRLQGLVAETREATDPAIYERADERFHRAVAEAARNALFLSLFDTLSASRRDATWRRLSENAHCFKRQSVHSAPRTRRSTRRSPRATASARSSACTAT